MMKTIKRTMPIPSYSSLALNRLKEHGFKGYIVGGAVRDFLIGNTPKDYDITTDALPMQVKEIFKDFYCEESGVKHGTVRVIIQSNPVEITTLRTEGSYSDFRHPDDVAFVRDILSDSKRRDFTINAFYYRDGIIQDPQNGMDDLKKKIIRAIGEPTQRFKEDALRVLRAIRFSSRFKFSIDNSIKKAMIECKDELKSISSERILSELYSISSTDNFYRSILIYRPIYEIIFEPLTNVDLSNYNFDFDSTGDNVSSLAALFSLPFMHDYLSCWRERMKLDNYVWHGLNILSKYKDIDFKSSWDNKFINGMLMETRTVERNQLIDFLYNLCNLKNIKDCDLNNKLDRIRSVEDIPLSTKDLKINGNDLVDMGIHGKDVGMILNDLLIQTNQENISNTRDEEILWIKKNYKNHG